MVRLWLSSACTLVFRSVLLVSRLRVDVVIYLYPLNEIVSRYSRPRSARPGKRRCPPLPTGPKCPCARTPTSRTSGMLERKTFRMFSEIRRVNFDEMICPECGARFQPDWELTERIPGKAGLIFMSIQAQGKETGLRLQSLLGARSRYCLWNHFAHQPRAGNLSEMLG